VTREVEPVKVTPEMRTAMQMLHHQGVTFYPTSRVVLGCGCFVLGGWDTGDFAPGVRVRSCSVEHEAAFLRVKARFDDPEAQERFHDVPSSEATATLLREEVSGS
jgi:hypothetical protein